MLFYLLWHGIILFWFYLLFELKAVHEANITNLYFLANDLVLLYGVLVVCVCNASHTIIAIAESMRPEYERGDIRHAITIFQKFRKKSYGVTLYNLIPLISARPIYYFLFLIVSVIIVVINILNVDTGLFKWWVFLLRNILILIWVSWLVLWYASAFMRLRKRLYPR